MIFTAVHLVGLVADSYVTFGWAEILVPMASGWKPGAVAFGVVSMYLLVAVEATSRAIRRLPRNLWRWVHRSSFVLFATATTTHRCGYRCRAHLVPGGSLDVGGGGCDPDDPFVGRVPSSSSGRRRVRCRARRAGSTTWPATRRPGSTVSHAAPCLDSAAARLRRRAGGARRSTGRAVRSGRAACSAATTAAATTATTAFPHADAGAPGPGDHESDGGGQLRWERRRRSRASDSCDLTVPTLSPRRRAISSSCSR